jgi:hypothetical protein
MTAKSEKIRDKRLISVMFIIIARFVLALLLSMLPVILGLNKESYVIPIVIGHAVLQFLWAMISLRSYFREIKNLISE